MPNICSDWPRARPGPAGARLLRCTRHAKHFNSHGRRRGGGRHAACSVAGMESVAYQAKRTHWGITWFAIRKFRAAAVDESRPRPELEHMTPARFDIMHLIELRYPYPQAAGEWRIHPRMEMRDIIDRLGLTPSTISKTLSGMVKRGLVERFDTAADGRRVVVALTDWGAKAYDAALAMLRTDRLLREQLERILTTLGSRDQPPGMTPEEHRANGMDIAHLKLRALARNFGYWADDLYESYFDARERSPIQHIIDVVRGARAARRQRRPAGRSREIALWEYWGAPRAFRRGPSSFASD